jgi:hypothetical protein
MAINDDLSSAANLCANAADAATDKLIALGPRPSTAPTASTWDAQDALLKNKISTLNNLSSSISALIVSNALQAIWPTLDALNGVTAAAQKDIDEIKDVSAAMAAVASVINFGVAVVTLTTQPTASNAGSLAKAFANMVSALKSNKT